MVKEQSLSVHVKNYFKAFGYDESSFIACEICGGDATDIHHVEPRSSFGSKRKSERDHVNNLVALCRQCHNMVHGDASRSYRIILKNIIATRDL